MSARTMKHFELLLALRKLLQRNREMPTLQILSYATGFTMGSVNHYIKKLTIEGYIYREKNQREICLTEHGKNITLPRPPIKPTEKKIKVVKVASESEREQSEMEKKRREVECFDAAVRLGKERGVAYGMDDVMRGRGSAGRWRVRATRVA